MLNGPTIRFSYQYVSECVKVAGSDCPSVSSPSVLDLKPGMGKGGTASAEADVAQSAAMVMRKRCILRKGVRGRRQKDLRVCTKMMFVVNDYCIHVLNERSLGQRNQEAEWKYIPRHQDP